MASFLHDRALPAFVDDMANCVHKQSFLEVFLSPCSDFHFLMKVFNEVFNAAPHEDLYIKY